MMSLALPTFHRLARFAAFLILPLVALLLATPSRAQTEEIDPPGRVGRLSLVVGQAWLYAPDEGEWVQAVANRPITSGNRIATDAGGRVELRIGSSTFRLDAGAELEVTRLDDERTGFQLHSGSLTARFRGGDALKEFELYTGEGRFTAQRTGRYRFDRADETSHLTVDSGQALFEGRGSALTVYSNQRAEFWTDAGGQAQYSITEPRRDAFAQWNNEQDRRDERSASARHVSPEMTGAEDLDRYGRWDHSEEYGSLWFPRGVASGWAPYSVGHWAWISPWGWTWVDAAPWGFAPFHYGRWVWYRDNWAWAPGRYVRRPVYAPALVAWVGGPRLNVSVSVGGGFAGPAVGWFPLAPREVYVPIYRVSPRYARGVNVNHGVNAEWVDRAMRRPGEFEAEQDYKNRKHHHGVTVVPATLFTARQPVGAAAAQWRDSAVRDRIEPELQRGPVLRAPPVTAPVFSARREDGRPAAAPGREAPRREDARREEGRREDGRREDGRRDDGRRDDGRRGAEPRWQAPAVVAAPMSPPAPSTNSRPPEAAARPTPPRPVAGEVATAPVRVKRPEDPRPRDRPGNDAPAPGAGGDKAGRVLPPERGTVVERGRPDRQHHDPRGAAPAPRGVPPASVAPAAAPAVAAPVRSARPLNPASPSNPSGTNGANPPPKAERPERSERPEPPDRPGRDRKQVE